MSETTMSDPTWAEMYASFLLHHCGNGYGGLNVGMKAELDALIAAAEKKGRDEQWSPASEEPTEDGWYLIEYESCYMAVLRTNGGYTVGTVADTWGEMARNGKRWMPLSAIRTGGE